MHNELTPLRHDLVTPERPTPWLAFALLLVAGHGLAVALILSDLVGRLFG